MLCRSELPSLRHVLYFCSDHFITYVLLHQIAKPLVGGVVLAQLICGLLLLQLAGTKVMGVNLVPLVEGAGLGDSVVDLVPLVRQTGLCGGSVDPYPLVERIVLGVGLYVLDLWDKNISSELIIAVKAPAHKDKFSEHSGN